MKKLNKKGFAITTIVYSILILLSLSMFIVLEVAKNSYENEKEYMADVNEELNNFLITKEFEDNFEYTKDFEYKGYAEEWTVPKTGYYKLEAWGAQGGTASSKIGGYGGYSTGIVRLTKDEKIYVNVGEQGKTCNGPSYGKTQACVGGTNGGGQGIVYYGSSSNYSISGSGGGATHIAIGNTNRGELKNYASYQNELLIVAGGGGGALYYASAGSGAGGHAGGYMANGSHSKNIAGGGTQVAGGSSSNSGVFGRGGNLSTSSYNIGGGGGGGYYGGGSAYYSSSAGGSGYIGNELLLSSTTLIKHMACYNCSTSTTSNYRTNSVSNVSETAISDYAKSGNGYARISYLNISSLYDSKKTTFEYSGLTETFTVSETGYYKLEAWGAQGGTASSKIGGYGGYSTGIIELTKNEKIYVTVGGVGNTCSGANPKGTVACLGSSNGGGQGIAFYGGSSNYSISGSGGGATHIAIGDTNRGELKNYASYQNELLIVAGGGGGALYYANDTGSGSGGHAGGATGNGTSVKNSSGGGKQNAGGSGANSGTFGQGGILSTSSYNIGGGGGGGYYGGGSAFYSPSAGGSGYIGSTSLVVNQRYMYCYNCGENSTDSTYTINTKGSNPLKDATNCPDGYSSNPISKCAKSGNGYARITYLGTTLN